MLEQEERIRELEDRIHRLENNPRQARGRSGKIVLWFIFWFFIFLISVGVIQFIAAK
ncbi:hypothetical protein [Paenibacillus sp. IHBB 10380]|uniref:hypothetical protein n=1 Tax=Paenibacillus sp. IHBB 10380 TaxID=1566358 RepID=UPI000AB227F4|nr:hypothetical protein [Paenibacillus sp. IHBB 10380]